MSHGRIRQQTLFDSALKNTGPRLADCRRSAEKLRAHTELAANQLSVVIFF